MNTLPWRTVCALLILIIITQNVLLLHSRYRTLATTTLFPETGEKPVLLPTDQSTSKLPWTFSPGRDANDYALTSRQCTHAFPSLYTDIHRAALHRQSDPITQNDTSISWRSDGAFRALIINNTLRILSTCNIRSEDYRQRTSSVLHQINRALFGAATTGEQLPNIEFAVTVDDMSLIPSEQGDTHAIWSFNRRLDDRAEDRIWLMPDFNFWAWPGIAGSYAEMRVRAALRDSRILDKDPRAVWRGTVWTNSVLREPLISHTENKSWADIKGIRWESWEPKNHVLANEDFCKYAFVIHTEGRSWSGRLKYLLNCDSVPVVHDLEWTTHYYHLLNSSGPEQNYVPVRRDFSDLEDKVMYYLAHPGEAQKIADNAVATFRDRYLTPAAEACYWRRLIKEWREVSFEPEVWETAQDTGKKRVRGIAFEEYALTDDWPQLEEK